MVHDNDMHEIIIFHWVEAFSNNIEAATYRYHQGDAISNFLICNIASASPARPDSTMLSLIKQMEEMPTMILLYFGL